MTRHMVVALLVWCSSGWAADEGMALLQVQGEALLQVVADQASLSLSVDSSGRDAERVIADNSQRVAQLINRLHQAGVTEAELRTTGFSVMPQWSIRPRDAEDGWQPSIVGYRVHNQLLLTTGKLTRLPGWIQVAVEAGSNRIGELQFSLADPQRHYQDALKLATENALRQAATVAAAASVQLGAIYQLQVESNQPRPLPGMRIETMALRSAAVPPPVEPGEVEVRAAVSVRYRLDP